MQNNLTVFQKLQVCAGLRQKVDDVSTTSTSMQNSVEYYSTGF